MPGALYYDVEWRLAGSTDWSPVAAFFAPSDDSLQARGYAPFFRQSRPVGLQIGEMRLASIPLTRLTLVGEPLLDEVDERAAFDSVIALLRSLRAHLGPGEALCFEALPLEGPAYRAITSHAFVREAFLLVHLGKPFEHHSIKMPATFDEYLHQFSARSRQNLLRGERNLSKDMEERVRLDRFWDASAVERFVADATRISRKTYQWNLLGLGLRDPEGLTRQLAYEAERGLLRCYILYCRDDPVAFMIGAQAAGAIYYYIDVGFDPDYAKWSVGSMLQLKVLRDLYSSPRDACPVRFLHRRGPAQGTLRQFLPSRGERDAVAEDHAHAGHRPGLYLDGAPVDDRGGDARSTGPEGEDQEVYPQVVRILTGPGARCGRPTGSALPSMLPDGVTDLRALIVGAFALPPSSRAGERLDDEGTPGATARDSPDPRPPGRDLVSRGRASSAFERTSSSEWTCRPAATGRSLCLATRSWWSITARWPNPVR